MLDQPLAPESTHLWQPLTAADGAAVLALAELAHPDLPERIDIVTERVRLFPAGCLKLVHASRLVAYGIAHPWRLGTAPKLDTLLGALPREPDCLHLHDVVVAPAARGRGAAARYFAAMEAVARACRLPALALVSVYGTNRLWARSGFVERAGPDLGGYGPTARYMVRALV